MIGDKDTVTGFRLAGADAFEARSPEEGEAFFKEALADDDVGLVILTEELANQLVSLEDAKKKAIPMVAVIPGFGSSDEIPSLGEGVRRRFGLGSLYR